MAIARNNNLSKSAKFFDSDGALNLVEGSNITITKNASAGTITIASTASGGGGSGTVDSAFVTGLPVSTFTNDVQYLDSTTVQGVIDATYIQANQTTYNTADFPDSAGVIALISANETTYTNVSEFTNDANYLDSTTVQGVIDQTYVRNNQITYNTSDFVDSAYVTTQINNLIGSAPGTLDTLEEIANALNNDSNAYGSLVALINGMADSDWVQSLPVSTFTNDANYLDSTTVAGVIDSAYIEARRPAETIFAVVNNGASAYTFTGDGFPSTSDNPTLYLARGKTYKFGVNASGHPFQIRVSSGGTAYSDGVTNNGAQVGDVIFTVPMNAPKTLVYQCTVHSGMVGNIIIFNENSFLDSSTVTGVIDATYIQANQTTYDFLDSAKVIALIDSDYVNARVTPVDAGTDSATVVSIIGETVDSAYVQARQITYNTSDFVDSAWVTGLPVSTFTNDVNYLTPATVVGEIDSTYIQANQITYSTADFLDSYYATALIDSAYIALRETPQDFAYSSLTGAPTTISSFTNDANYLDSTTVQGVIDGTYIQANQITYSTLDFPDSAGVTTLANAAISSAIGSSILAYDSNLQDFVDTFTLPTTDGATNHVLLTNGSGTLSFASVASVSGATDSGDVRNLIDEVVDSAFVALHQVPQDFAYSSLTGAPTNVSSFTNDANYLDSTTVQGVIDATYVQNNQITYNTSDFLDSTTVYPLFSAGTGVTYNGGGVFSIGQSVGTSDDVTFADVTVDNLTVNGTTTTVNSITYTVTDPLLHLADSNETSDVVDIGFVGHYSDDGGSTKRHTGFFRDASNGQYYVFNGLVDAGLDSSLPVNIVNRGGTDFELAAFNAGSLAGKYLGFDSDFNVKAPLTNISTFINDANYLDSTTVQGVIDATYIQANQTTYDFLDSAETIALIDSAYVQLRQDYAYASLTGAPTNVSSFVNDANYLDSTTVTGVIDAAYIQANQTTYDFLDSAEAIALIDSAYINARVDAVDAGTDSATVVTIINETVDSAYVQLRVPATYIQANQTTYSTDDFLDSTYALALLANNTINVGGLTVNSAYTLPTADGSSNNVLSTNGSGTLSFVSVASISGTVDSSDVRNIVDSDYIAARLSPALVSYEYTATNGQTTFSGADDNGITLSYYAGKIQVFLNGVLLRDTDDYTASNTTSVVLGSGADSGDLISMFTFGYGPGQTTDLTEEFTIKSNSFGGNVNYDVSTSTIFYHTGGSDSTGFVPNFQNVVATSGISTTAVIFVDQDSTPTVPTSLMIDSAVQTINWIGGSEPVGSALKKEAFSFTLMRVNSDWIVLGQNAYYG